MYCYDFVLKTRDRKMNKVVPLGSIKPSERINTKYLEHCVSFVRLHFPSAYYIPST